MRHLTILLALLSLTPLPAAAQGPAPAQSRLGMNLSGPADWSTEYPFVDVFKLSRRWISQRQGQPWGKGPELDRDENGWITRLDPDCWAETPVLTAGHAPSGDYTCLYDGDGTVEVRNARKIVSTQPGRIVATIDGAKGGVWVRVSKTNPADPVRNIRLIMPGHEETYAREPFNPAFLQRWAPFNTFRFMDWMHTNGSKIRRWSDRPTPAYCNYTEKGVPIEVMVDLCNRLQVNPWFCMPHLADDDYLRHFAAQVKQSLAPSLKAYVEYSNEVWNSQFAQTRYANEQGRALNLAEKDWEAGWRFSARRSVEIFRIWEDAFGGRDRLVRVIASQMVPHVSEAKLSFESAAKHCDALAIAPYIQFSIPVETKSYKPWNADAISKWPLEKVMDHLESQSLPAAITGIQAQKKIADKYGLTLVAYEAGQHLVGIGGAENNQALTQLLHAANRHPRMGAIYTKYLDAWKAAGGDLCCLFASTGQWSKWGSWGLTQYMDETEKDQPKLGAVMEWNRRNPR